MTVPNTNSPSSTATGRQAGAGAERVEHPLHGERRREPDRGGHEAEQQPYHQRNAGGRHERPQNLQLRETIRSGHARLVEHNCSVTDKRCSSTGQFPTMQE